MSSPKLKSIAIVTPDIRGPVRNGGVGTAYAALAEMLAAEGHRVTILFANRWTDEDTKFHHHQKRFWGKGIRLVSLPEPKVRLVGPDPARLSYAVYLYLKENRFDIVHFPDLFGLGYFSLLAKKQGIAFSKTLLTVMLHGPSSWHKEGNRESLSAPSARLVAVLERKSVEWADVLVAPSRYALSWAKKNKWKLPASKFVHPCPYFQKESKPKTSESGEFTKIVFFGRLETRKGIEVFCDAIRSLPKNVLANRKVVFLGSYGTIQKMDAEVYLKRATRNWPRKPQVISNLGQEEALKYLRSNQALVVIPSRSETFGYTTFECISSSIPMIASNIPAFRELIAKKHHKTVLFELKVSALRKKIEEALKDGVSPATLAIDHEVNRKFWIRFHRQAVKKAPVKSRAVFKRTELKAFSSNGLKILLDGKHLLEAELLISARKPSRKPRKKSIEHSGAYLSRAWKADKAKRVSESLLTNPKRTDWFARR